jgi:hypothetical protein
MIYMDPDVIGGSIGTLVQDPEVGELIMRVLLSGRDKVQELKRVLKTLTQQ